MRNVGIPSSLSLFLFPALVPLDTLAICRPEYQNLPGGLVHTACKPPNPDCILVKTGLSASDKAEALKAHNDLRSQVAQGRLSGFPTATNMHRLEWDDELAEVAQAFADQCKGQPDKQEQRITTKFQNVGQNFAHNLESTNDPVAGSASHVKEWFDQYKDFNPGNVDSFSVTGGRCY
ncbi:hypothetical protein HPB52_007708 [Rhipicephalus sanguineus]|uniref:SCP domain-containing protein n=1 Tax=Rhipicephalus sanguineus TaxID=34632 RepID=A0A9D4Q668_RHISA|nr:hypothetical protein HPB52_007708 [Rhipicephalus sanguineus]